MVHHMMRVFVLGLVAAVIFCFGKAVIDVRAQTYPGTWLAQTAETSTPNNTNETDLTVTQVPPNTLGVNGQSLRYTCYGVVAANGNTKQMRLYFGATVMADTSAIALNNGTWRLDATVTRTSPTAQKFVSNVSSNNNGVLPFLLSSGAASETLTGSVTMKVTGQNGAASAGDITVKGCLTELLL